MIVVVLVIMYAVLLATWSYQRHPTPSVSAVATFLSRTWFHWHDSQSAHVWCVPLVWWVYCSRNFHTSFLCVIAECFTHLSHGLGICLFVRLFVCLSVRHTAVLYQNCASQDHEIFTVGCRKDSRFLWQNFVPLDEGFPRMRASKRGTPSP